MKHRGHTPPLRGADGEIVPGSVAEIARLRLGGIDQWVLIRGESASNPLLIFLSGGPGLSEAPLFRHFNAALETDFLVVYWDQRGSGKSFDGKLPRAALTVERFVSDLDELVDAMRRRFNQERVVLFGHSWGTALGALYAARYPEKVAVYVGSGQIGDWSEAESRSYAYALAEAERQQNRRALKALRKIGPPPYDARAVFRERTWVQRLQGQLTAKALWKMVMPVIRGPETSIFDLRRMMRAFRSTLDAMWPEVSKLNVTQLVHSLQMPVFLFVGREDHWVPPETSLAFFDALAAPMKRLIWFDHSGHEPFVDEPAKFNATMAELVRPLAA